MRYYFGLRLNDKEEPISEFEDKLFCISAINGLMQYFNETQKNFSRYPSPNLPLKVWGGNLFAPLIAPRKSNIRRLNNFSGQAWNMEKWCGRMREDHLWSSLLHKWRQVRWWAGPSRPEAALAGCFAMTLSAYNGTPAQPQPVFDFFVI